jgi:YfiR/HmsC-like
MCGERVKDLLRLHLVFGPWLALFLNSGPVQAQSASEYEVKAAFLYKFASFVEWPSPTAGAPICIGVLGADHFGEALDRIVRGKQVGDRAFTIQRFRTAGEASHCDIVFISGSEQGRLREILGLLRGKPVLTVSEIPDFCQRGGAINLKVIDAAIRFEINPVAGERSGIRFSSKLLSLAKVIAEASP